MKLTEILVVVISSCCVIVKITDCAEFASRGSVRQKNFGRSVKESNEPKIESDDLKTTSRLETIIERIEEKIEQIQKFESNFVKIVSRLEVLQKKLDKIDENLFSEKITDEANVSISTRLVFWFSELDRKIDQLINQKKKTFDDSNPQTTDQPLHLELSQSLSPLDVEIVAEQLRESLESFGEKVQQNFSKTGEKLEHLRRYLQFIFEANIEKNISSSDGTLMQIQRKERRISDHSVLINKILSMVKEKLASEGDDDDEPAQKSSSWPDMVSTFENMRSPQSNLTQKKKTTLTSRKHKVIFPNVKYKPLKLNTSFISESLDSKNIKGFSCVELMNAGMRQSGVYYLQIRGTTYWFLKVYCEQEIADGGWTVIQRRDDFGEPRENFNRDWADYKNGFGDPAKEFWMGNENIYMLTNNEDYALRIELEDFEGNKRYAQYSHFKIHSEADYYKLEIDGYEGNAGDSLNDLTYGSNNSPFSTYDRDNDRSSLNCASMLKGGWWWKSCGRGLNGLYLNESNDPAAKQGIIWFKWQGWDYTLKKSTMMVKALPKSMTSR